MFGGGPSFEFSPPPNFLSSIPSIPYNIAGGIPPFSIAATTTGETSTANNSSNNSYLQQQPPISSSRGISKSPVPNKLSPQQKCGGRVSQPGFDGCTADNSNNSQWSPISENSSCQANRDQQDPKIISEHKVEIYEETDYNNQQASPQRILPRTSTPYSPEGRQLVIDDNAEDHDNNNNSDGTTNHQIQHNFSGNFNNGGTE
uniref:Uncharacterized protein n=1 Tax=Meloidogyne enterolobii TaxID=390850 RepID=A0A6V7Y1S6_MELEN|nr:unnamed protein product [Meloidogyne enterolobii]